MTTKSTSPCHRPPPAHEFRDTFYQPNECLTLSLSPLKKKKNVPVSLHQHRRARTRIPSIPEKKNERLDRSVNHSALICKRAERQNTRARVARAARGGWRWMCRTLRRLPSARAVYFWSYESVERSRGKRCVCVPDFFFLRFLNAFFVQILGDLRIKEFWKRCRRKFVVDWCVDGVSGCGVCCWVSKYLFWQWDVKQVQYIDM